MSKPPRSMVTVFIMNDGRYVKEHDFDQIMAENDTAWAKVEEINKEYAAFSAKSEVVCTDYANKIAEKDKLIEQMRDALQWYKEQVSSCNRNGDAGELARDRLAKDVGKRAEAALSEVERGE